MPGLFQDREDVAFRPAGTESNRGDAPLADAVIEIFEKKPGLAIPRDRKGVCEEAEGLVAEDLPRVSAEIAAAPDVITLVDKPPADPPVRRVECSFENRPRRPAGEINKRLGG